MKEFDILKRILVAYQEVYNDCQYTKTAQNCYYIIMANNLHFGICNKAEDYGLIIEMNNGVYIFTCPFEVKESKYLMLKCLDYRIKYLTKILMSINNQLTLITIVFKDNSIRFTSWED